MIVDPTTPLPDATNPARPPTVGMKIDNTRLSLVVPTPGTKDDCKNGGFTTFGFDNQGQCVASITADENAGK